MRISDWSSDVCSSDLSSTWWFLVLPGQWCASVPARQVDAACDAAVVHVAAAGRAHGEVAARAIDFDVARTDRADRDAAADIFRSEEHTSELQSLMRNSYAVFCLKKKKQLSTSNHYAIHTTCHIV